MQRDDRPPRLLAIIAFALGIGACKRVASEHPDPAAEPGRHDDRGPTEAAKASFAEVAGRYAAAKARGRLATDQCDELAKAFLHVFEQHGPSMAIAKFDAGAVRE